MASIGSGCIINMSAVVEHECVVGDFTHVSVNSKVAGRSTIGTYGFIGAGAIVIDGIRICNNITIGAGSVMIRDVDYSGVYVGSSAHLVQK